MPSKTLGAALLLSSLAAAVPTAEVQKFSSPSDPARFKAYNTLTPGGVICDGDSGPDGHTLWYQDLVASKMGVFNYKTGKVKEYPIPYSSGSEDTPPFLGNLTGLQCVVRTGKDGMVYGGAGIRNEIVMLNPRVSPPTLKIFQSPNVDPAGNLINFNDAWGANDGLYFSQLTANLVTRFDYLTHQFKNFPAITPGATPLGMRTDKFNNLWFTDFLGQFLSVINNETGIVTEYKDCCPLPYSAFPEVLRSSTENQKYLWSNAFGFQGFIRIEPQAVPVAFENFNDPDASGLATFPFENSNDFCGRVWFTSPDQDKLVYYDPADDTWTTVTVPATVGVPVGGNFEVIMHRGPGHYMYFSIGTLGKIIRYSLDADCVGQPQ